MTVEICVLHGYIMMPRNEQEFRFVLETSKVRYFILLLLCILTDLRRDVLMFHS